MRKYWIAAIIAIISLNSCAITPDAREKDLEELLKIIPGSYLSKEAGYYIGNHAVFYDYEKIVKDYRKNAGYYKRELLLFFCEDDILKFYCHGYQLIPINFTGQIAGPFILNDIWNDENTKISRIVFLSFDGTSIYQGNFDYKSLTKIFNEYGFKEISDNSFALRNELFIFIKDRILVFSGNNEYIEALSAGQVSCPIAEDTLFRQAVSRNRQAPFFVISRIGKIEIEKIDFGLLTFEDTVDSIADKYLVPNRPIYPPRWEWFSYSTKIKDDYLDFNLEYFYDANNKPRSDIKLIEYSLANLISLRYSDFNYNPDNYYKVNSIDCESNTIRANISLFDKNLLRDMLKYRDITFYYGLLGISEKTKQD